MPTSATEIAALVTYVVPGFVFLKVAGFFLPPRSSQGTDVAILSVLWSFPLTFIAASAIDWRGLAKSPELTAVVASGLGAAAALLLGWLYTKRAFRLFVGRLTNMSELRIWIGLLDRRMYVQVQIDTNDVFYGYPAIVSNDPSADWPDIYLREASTVANDGKRELIENTDGLFIPGGRIRMIQFLLPGTIQPPSLAIVGKRPVGKAPEMK